MSFVMKGVSKIQKYRRFVPAGLAAIVVLVGGALAINRYNNHLKAETARLKVAAAEDRAEFEEQMQRIEAKRKEELDSLSKAYQQQHQIAQNNNPLTRIPEARLVSPPAVRPLTSATSPPAATFRNGSSESPSQAARQPGQWSDDGTSKICMSARSYKRQTGRSILKDTVSIGVWSQGQETRDMYMNLSRACPDAL